ncbi:MAG: nucleoside hydrolase [Synergistaceae bacterium]|nr:nucleoside hydrolase [Synergistaceae bacterium]
MYRKIYIALLVISLSANNGEAARKVIIDTDIAYLNDDALAVFMLAQADKAGMLELLGVTTASSNVFVPEATTAALRQLELIGRNDIRVYQGTDEPLAGFRNMEEESRLYGIPNFCGAYWDFSKDDFADLSKRPKDYLHLNSDPMFGYPETRAQDLPAWDFIIESVKANPGEVTIMAVGAATNIAVALKKYPALAEEVAGIIYMGGDIDVPGNATPAAEMNWYYDPDAIKFCLAANWKSQIIVPDDLAQQIILTSEFYERLAEKEPNAITKLILSDKRTFTLESANYVWDVVVPAVFLRPELITDLQTRYITVDTTPGINSGRAVTWQQNDHNDMAKGTGFPEGVNKAQIVMKIDKKAFWDFYIDLLAMK